MNQLDELRNLLSDMKNVTIAFSGGVDSSLLAMVAYQTLGPRAHAVTLKTEFIPEDELSNAKMIAKLIGIKHVVLYHSVLKGTIVSNPLNRCYLCKDTILNLIPYDNIIDGTNADDDPTRPGLKALKEHNIISPLKMCGIAKADIRKYTKQFGLPNHDAPSNSCLATRIPHNTIITKEKLEKIEMIETEFHKMGVHDVRARLHDTKVKIELTPEGKIFLENNHEKIDKVMTSAGLSYEIGDR